MKITTLLAITTALFVFITLLLSHHILSSTWHLIAVLGLSAAGFYISVSIPKKYAHYLEMTMEVLLIAGTILIVSSVLGMTEATLATSIEILTKILVLCIVTYSFMQFNYRRHLLLLIIAALLTANVVFLQSESTRMLLFYITVQFFIWLFFLRFGYLAAIHITVLSCPKIAPIEIGIDKKSILNTCSFFLSSIVVGCFLFLILPRLEKSPLELLAIDTPFSRDADTGLATSSTGENLTYNIREGGLGDAGRSRYRELLDAEEPDNIPMERLTASEEIDLSEEESKEEKSLPSLDEELIPPSAEESWSEAEKAEDMDEAGVTAFPTQLLRWGKWALCGLCLIGVYLAARYIRGRRTIALSTSNPRRFTISVFHNMLEILRFCGVAHDPSWTLEEYIPYVESHFSKGAPHFKNMVDIFQKARYSNFSLLEKEIMLFAQLYRQVLGVITEQTSLLRRIFIQIKTMDIKIIEKN
ncbi:MAG: hypothetical protein JW844_02120 [Candidatus Omnitrophica bacterium]|nr:hypothetical protein [Candidatus Omnitrophota bacterium]